MKVKQILQCGPYLSITGTQYSGDKSISNHGCNLPVRYDIELDVAGGPLFIKCMDMMEKKN